MKRDIEDVLGLVMSMCSIILLIPMIIFAQTLYVTVIASIGIFALSVITALFATNILYPSKTIKQDKRQKLYK